MLPKRPNPRERAARIHRARTEYHPPKTNYNGQGEAEVVPGFQLAKALQKFCREWLVDHPYGVERMGGINHVGPVGALAAESGLHIRRVGGICNGEFPFVPLSQADLLLLAANMQHLLVTEIQVVPNPNWSPEKWIAYMQSHGCMDD